MANPSIRSYSTYSSTAGSIADFDVPMPAGTQEGDLLVLAFIADTTSGFWNPSSPEMHRLTTAIVGTSTKMGVVAGYAPASPGSSINIDLSTGTADSVAAICIAFQDVRPDLPFPTWSNTSYADPIAYNADSSIATQGDTVFDEVWMPHDVWSCMEGTIRLSFYGWQDGSASITDFDTLTEIATVTSGATSSNVCLSCAYLTMPSGQRENGRDLTISSDVERGAYTLYVWPDPARNDGAYDAVVDSYTPTYRWLLDGGGLSRSNDPADDIIAANVGWGLADGTVTDFPSEIGSSYTVKLDSGSAEYQGVIPDKADINTSAVVKRAMSIWVRFGDVTTRSVVFKQGGGTNGIAFYVESGTLYFTVWESSSTKGYASYAVATNTTYHILGVFDAIEGSSNHVKLYVNGSLVDTSAWTGGTDLASHSGDNVLGGGNPNNYRTIADVQGNTDTMSGRVYDFCYWSEQTRDWDAVALGIYNAGWGIGGSSPLLLRLRQEYGMAL